MSWVEWWGLIAELHQWDKQLAALGFEENKKRIECDKESGFTSRNSRR